MTNWRDLADCVYTDPDAFFDAHTVEFAKGVCDGCPVKAECLGAAMREEAPKHDDTPEVNRFDRWGVRGGLDADERWARQYPELAEVAA